LVSKEKRGIATSLVAGIGLTGAIVAFIFKQNFEWRTCDFIGGGMGLALLFLRIYVFESGMYHEVKNSDVEKGNFLSLSENDRRAVLISLYALTFPIGYDILLAFAVGFKVQEFISKRVVLEKMGALYGSNRSMHIGVDETIPLFLDCGIITRQKIGIYAKGLTLKITNNFVSELIIYSNIKLSGSKSILVDELNFKPWYSYFEKVKNFCLLGLKFGYQI
jgi:hypothetical protein